MLTSSVLAGCRSLGRSRREEKEHGISNGPDATVVAAPPSSELISLSPEDKFLDVPGAILDGDASNVINMPVFTEVFREISRGVGVYVGALGDCCLGLDIEDRDSLE